MTLKKKIIYLLIISMVFLLFIVSLYYWIIFNLQEGSLEKEEFICPDLTKLIYNEESKIYIQGTDCMPHEGVIYVGNPSYEKWVNKNCGIKFKYECTSY